MKKPKLTEDEKATVIRMANGLCEYCKYPMSYSHDKFHFDHIFPLSKGGLHDLLNIAYSCDYCNSNKWVYTEWKDPESGHLVRLFNPRQDEWLNHFKWSDDLIHVIGITPIGRATMVLLELNRPGLINARKALISHGSHPAQNKIT